MHVRFPEMLKLRTPKGLSAAVQAAAARHHTSPPEWMRQALLRSLATEGLLLRDDGKIEKART